MTTVAKLRGSDFDSMVERGAFDSLEPMKIERIHGELRFMNPAGPIHEGEIEYLTRWSVLLLIEASDSSLKQDLGEKDTPR